MTPEKLTIAIQTPPVRMAIVGLGQRGFTTSQLIVETSIGSTCSNHGFS